jgi:phage protein, HK97 gp10 family
MATTRITMKLEGMEALQRAITDAPDQAKAHSQDAVSKSTFAVFSKMQARAPHDTGGLRMAMRWSAPGLTGRITIDAGAFYWRFLEYGTVKMTARPFIRPSTEEESSNFIRRMQDFGNKLERSWGRL